MEELLGDKFRGLMENDPSGETDDQAYHNRIKEIFRQVGAQEITPQLGSERINEIIGELTLIDPMTGLSSKRGIIVAINKLIASSIRFQTPFTVLFIDGDHFKDINDTAGHEAGDEAIMAIGKAMEILRENDTAGHISGDEFVVLLPGTDFGTAKVVVEKLQQEIGLQVKQSVSGYERDFSATAGIAQFDPKQYQDAQLDPEKLKTIRRNLFRDADLAMYEARKDGARGQIGLAK